MSFTNFKEIQGFYTKFHAISRVQGAKINSRLFKVCKELWELCTPEAFQMFTSILSHIASIDVKPQWEDQRLPDTGNFDSQNPFSLLISMVRILELLEIIIYMSIINYDSIQLRTYPFPDLAYCESLVILRGECLPTFTILSALNKSGIKYLHPLVPSLKTSGHVNFYHSIQFPVHVFRQKYAISQITTLILKHKH